MDDLEIKIAITYRIPRNNLTLNGLLRGLERDRDEIVAPEASGEAIFSGFTLKWPSAFKMDKMVTLGSRSTFRKPLNCPKNGEKVKSSLSARTTGWAVFPGCRVPFAGSRICLNSGKSSTRPRLETILSRPNLMFVPIMSLLRQKIPVSWNGLGVIIMQLTGYESTI